MNVAIVDDIPAEIETLVTLLNQYEASENQPLKIKSFSRGSEFLSEYIRGAFDIVFLDIFLDDENGVDCARELRKLDENIHIIFLTTSSEFGVKSYDVKATDYIIKPVTSDKLSRAFCYCRIYKQKSSP